LPDLIIADEWATGKFDGRANAHPGPPLATPLALSHVLAPPPQIGNLKPSS